MNMPKVLLANEVYVEVSFDEGNLIFILTKETEGFQNIIYVDHTLFMAPEKFVETTLMLVAMELIKRAINPDKKP